MKKTLCAFLAVILMFSLAPFAAASSGPQYFQRDYSSLIFGADRRPDATINTDGVTYNVYRVRYCVNPVAGLDPGYFMINIKVPVSYHGIEFTAEELAKAPILFTNPWGADIGSPAPNAEEVAFNYRILSWLKQGWVTVEPGMRGIEAVINGIYYGKIPNPIVDLKAAIRYLRFGSNATNIPGDKEKIFFSGFSSGGTAASIIGASGNTHMFDEYLDAIGAVPGRDDVFAAIPGAPLIAHNYSSSALTWQLYYDDSKTLEENLTQFKYTDDKVNRVNAGLLKEFVEYLDELKITASINGRQEMLTAANLDDYILQFIIDAADNAGDRDWDRTWRAFWDSERNFSGMYGIFESIFQANRGEVAWIFDDIDDGGGMWPAFGFNTDERSYVLSFGLYWMENYLEPPATIDPKLIEILEFQYKSVNPLHFILSDTNDRNIAPYWFIHQGTVDPAFSLAFLLTMNAALEMKGADTRMTLEWGVDHHITQSIDDDIIAWAREISGVGSWTDGASNWALPELSEALSNGLILEDMVGNWTRPTNRLLAAKAITNLIEKATGKTIDQIAAEKGYDMTNTFTDTNDKSVTFLKAARISNGVGNNSYNPTGTYTRAQMVTMLGRMTEEVFDLDLSGFRLGTDIYNDLNGFSYADQYIGWAADMRITLGDGGRDTFNPRGTLQNQQTVAFTLRSLKTLPLAYITFNGPTINDITASGLIVSPYGDALPPVMTQVGGQWALRSGDYIYFFITNDEIRRAETVIMDITYYDNNENWFIVEYCSNYPGDWNGIDLYKFTHFEKTGTEEFRTVRLELDRCNFTTGHNQGAQFRFGYGGDYLIKSVTISVLN